ncbi:DUF5667 domain-containing protein [Frankia sp. CcWB2]
MAGGGRGAERVADLLDGQRPSHDETDVRLIDTVAALRDLPSPRLHPARRAALRGQLFAAVTGSPACDPVRSPAAGFPGTSVRSHETEARPTRTRPTRASPESVDHELPGNDPVDARWVRRTGASGVSGRGRMARAARPLLAGALTAAVTTAALAVSSGDALPGDTLYGVKRQVEELQVSLVRNPVERAKTRLGMAGTRMSELRTITVNDSGVIAPETGAGAPETSLRVPVVNPTAIAAPPAIAMSPAAVSPAAGTWSPGPRTPAVPGSAGRSDGPNAPGGPPGPGNGDRPDPALVNALLRDWLAEAHAGTQVLLARVAAGDADAWTTVNAFTTEQSRGLKNLLRSLPVGSVGPAHAALDLIDDVRRRLGPRAPAPVQAPSPVRPISPIVPAGDALTTPPYVAPLLSVPRPTATGATAAPALSTPTPSGADTGSPGPPSPAPGGATSGTTTPTTAPTLALAPATTPAPSSASVPASPELIITESANPPGRRGTDAAPATTPADDTTASDATPTTVGAPSPQSPPDGVPTPGSR